MKQLEVDDDLGIIIEREPRQEVPISRIVCSVDAVNALKQMRERSGRNFHDLLILFGPANQQGSVRLITQATVVPNELPNRSFKHVAEVTDRELQARRALDGPNLEIMGIGTYLGVTRHIKTAFAMGYPLYCTAAVADAVALGSIAAIRYAKFTRPRFLTQDLRENMILIPEQNIYLAY